LECGEGGVCDWVYEAGFEEWEGQVVWECELYWTIGAVDFDGEDGVGYGYGLRVRRDVCCEDVDLKPCAASTCTTKGHMIEKVSSAPRSALH